MQGLRTQETTKFKHFFALVQREAKKQNSVFFLDCGEGREFETERLSGEDLSGWLIPLTQAEQFQAQFDQNKISDQWAQWTRFAIWSKQGSKVCITFQEY